MKQPIRIIAIEDEPGIALALYRTFNNDPDYRVVCCKTGSSGINRIQQQDFDVILLDLGLPDISGLTVCGTLRRSGVTTPIIVLTGEGAVTSKVALLNAGANDYITKPFSMDELQARIHATLRSTGKKPPQMQLRTGDLLLDPESRTAHRAGTSIVLRRKEFEILAYLMQYPGTVITRARILAHVWDGDDNWTNTVDVHIKQLRDKIDRPFATTMIKTVYGVGYKLDASAVAEKITGGEGNERGNAGHT